MRVQRYPFAGVLLDGVDGFRVAYGTYADDAQYGIFPIHSRGRVDHNVATGANDTGIYVGQSSGVLVDANLARANMIGIEVALSTDVQVSDNIATGNSVGLVVQIVPGLPATRTDRVTLTGNVLTANTRPNTITDPDELLALLPGGVGVLDIAADHVTVTGNVITANPTAGLGVVSLPAAVAALDPRLDPTPDSTLVTGNTIAGNGHAPDPRIAPLPPADLVWGGTGTANCFSTGPGTTTFPATLPQC